MSSLTCAEVEEALPALAIGALDEDERAAVAAHITTCTGCRAQFAQYGAVTRGFLGAVPLRIPPPAMKRALMSRVESETVSPLTRLTKWLGTARAWPRWAYGVATAIVLVVVGSLGVQTVRLSDQQVRLQAAVRQQQAVLAALASTTTDSVSMTGTVVAAGATAVMRYDPQSNLAVVKVQNLPPLPSSKAYQLWLIYPDGRRDSGAVFTIPATMNSEVTLVVVAPQPLKAYAGCGVSIEPSGGSPRPTGPAALTGKLWS